LSILLLASFCSAPLQHGAPTREGGWVSGELARAELREGETLEVGQEGREGRLSAHIHSQGTAAKSPRKGRDAMHKHLHLWHMINRAAWQAGAIVLFLTVR